MAPSDEAVPESVRAPLAPLGVTGSAIGCGFYVRGDGIIGGFVGTRHARRGHRVGSQFAIDLLPELGIGADARNLRGIEHKATGLETGVMASDAVSIEDRAGILGSDERNQREDWYEQGYC